MKTAMLLQTPENQLNRLRRRCVPLAHHITLSARFDRHLFYTRSALLQVCLDEAGDNLTALHRTVEQQQSPRITWLAEHLASQLEAISRETASWSLREWDSASPGLACWQHKRAQHQELERCLVEMTRECKEHLAQATGFEEQQKLHREVEVFEVRLARCRHVLARIENMLSRLTRQSPENLCH